MGLQDSAAKLIRKLNSLQQQLITDLEMLSSDMTGEDVERKKEAGRKLNSTLSALADVLAKEDHPDWLKPLSTQVTAYVQEASTKGSGAGFALFRHLKNSLDGIYQHKWHDGPSDKLLLDFATISQDAYLNSTVPRLFDELISELEQIVASGHVVDIRAIRALEDLIGTIRKNSHKDLVSARGTLQIAKVLLRKITLNFLEKIPVLGVLVKSARETMKELDIKIEDVEFEVIQKCQEKAAAAFPMLGETTIFRLALPLAAVDDDFFEFPDVELENPGQAPAVLSNM